MIHWLHYKQIIQVNILFLTRVILEITTKKKKNIVHVCLVTIHENWDLSIKDPRLSLGRVTFRADPSVSTQTRWKPESGFHDWHQFTPDVSPRQVRSKGWSGEHDHKPVRYGGRLHVYLYVISKINGVSHSLDPFVIFVNFTPSFGCK